MLLRGKRNGSTFKRDFVCVCVRACARACLYENFAAKTIACRFQKNKHFLVKNK